MENALLFHLKFDTEASSIGDQGQGTKVDVLTERPEHTIPQIGKSGWVIGKALKL